MKEVVVAYIPESSANEYEYIVKTLIEDFLDSTVEIRQWADNKVLIHLNKRNIEIDCNLIQSLNSEGTTFFSRVLVNEYPNRKLVRCESDVDELPFDTLKIIGLSSTEVPIEYSNSSIKVKIDLFGAAFITLTRAEERLKPTPPDEPYFPTPSELDLKLKDEPIVDYYTSLLAYLLNQLSETRTFHLRPQKEILLTVDIDRPFLFEEGMVSIARRLGGDLFRRRSLRQASSLVSNFIRKSIGLPHKDPFDTFDLIFKLADDFKLKLLFFIPSIRRVALDPIVNCQNSKIQKLMKTILDNNHLVGLHGSIKSSKISHFLYEEVDMLRKTLWKIGENQNIEHARQHYLSFDPNVTANVYINSGLKHDHSMGWSNYPGFRSGTSSNYKLFSPFKKSNSLSCYPLVIMDSSLGNARRDNFNLRCAKAMTVLNFPKRESRIVPLLWHNDWIANSDVEYALLRRLLNYILAPNEQAHESKISCNINSANKLLYKKT